MGPFHQRLSDVKNAIVQDELDWFALRAALKDFKNILLEICAIGDIDRPEFRQNLDLATGMALGTSWAVRCLDDIVRTRQFIRGVFRAVQDLRSQRAGPVNILYAGTGPFAALVLLLITEYSNEDIQFHLVEINEQSRSALKRVIAALDIQPYVANLSGEDAANITVPHPSQIDLLVSETMQHALESEAQLPIMLNLVPQLKDDIVVIPAAIRLDLAYMNLGSGELGPPKRHIIAPLMTLDLDFICKAANAAPRGGGARQALDLIEALPLPPYDPAHPFLAILTHISVYDDIAIKWGESGLTIQKLLLDLSQENGEMGSISMRYALGETPGVTFTRDLGQDGAIPA